MTDDELLRGFQNCTLPNDAFRHREHVRAAFLILSRYPMPRALELFSDSLKRFAAAHGKPSLYHETITWAYLLLIRERLERAGRPMNWEEFAGANGDLLAWKDSVLKSYYKDETLASDLARKIFLLPDRHPPST